MENRIDSMTIITKNQYEREANNKIQEITKKYKDLFNRLVAELFKLRNILISKDNHISYLINLLSEVSTENTENRVNYSKPSKKAQNHHQHELEIKSLVQEINSLQAKVSSFKEMCQILQNETDKATELAKTFDKDRKRQENDSKNEYINLSLLLKKKEADLVNDKKSLESE